MKKLLLIPLLLVIVTACSGNKQDYQSISTEELFTRLNWDMNYSTVRGILTKDFQLSEGQEIKQLDSTGRVYEFSGCRYNDVETESWLFAFHYDSLRFITIKIAKESASENEEMLNGLTELNDIEMTADTTKIENEKRWHYKKDGKYISDVLITMMPEMKGLSVLLSKPIMNY